ncbi:MAG: formamidopyrimidine-DNA glycosylase [Candidatus Nealsonbacteria bacterium CG_4_10_14_0_2_um_filter_38_17]|uniref:Formamidopyrimidine-DNA glycosylase n=2 Tax=Candidatus Nealsoniibacteriota TaxID=1817911 RepID=A0A2M7UXC4_9BACT|nr:MAG: formamidopyrimidine-DNA glycosylase [Candidatus Nealsonbacteria bacterium CG23_combo_of_CG06-09_8_20_14_all_38_19]PIZ88643.1 MAG: formamidopyrimidine-DNA glycosylase [Candidatus Nealsonbacteria bacterium CG_4_10_14_0_2_um_filter_38_17]
MPELPEVETTVRDLKKKVLSRTFIDVWADSKKNIKKPGKFEVFKKEIKGRKINEVGRRGKNILIFLSGDKTLLIHQKLTGHLLLGKWRLKDGSWMPLLKGPLEEPVNKFIHLVFWLSGDLMLALSDLRKFAKIELWDSKELECSEVFRKLGPDPLNKDFTFKKFEEALKNKRGKIKKVLMDQNVIAGIGNIYSDEILWEAKIHPLKEVSRLSKQELKKIYLAMKKILQKAIILKGDSMSDYRLLTGEKGDYQEVQKVYQREGKGCPWCGGTIKRVKINGRSAHYCPQCQKL